LSAGCASKRALFCEGRFLIHNSPLNALKPAGIALTSDAAQVAGLGRIYFGTSSRHEFSRIAADGGKYTSTNARAYTVLSLIIRFLFSYT
jgi:hypothetical protein